MEKTVILYDSECILCSQFIRWIIRLDSKQRFYFTDQQSQYFDFLKKLGKVTLPLETVYLHENGIVYKKSEAVFRILKHLPWTLKWLYIFKMVPLSLRDSVYDWVSRNRYRLFGKKDSCKIEPQLLSFKGRMLL